MRENRRSRPVFGCVQGYTEGTTKRGSSRVLGGPQLKPLADYEGVD